MTTTNPIAITASPQQAAVVQFVQSGRGSAFVEAVAGSGKTTTLIKALVETTGSVAFCAYNKAIAVEISAKVSKLNLGNRVRVGTFHSFGFNAWRRIHPKVEVDARKKEQQSIQEMTRREVPQALHSFVLKLVGLAKQRAMTLAQASDQSLWYAIVEHFDLAYEIEDEGLVQAGIEQAITMLKFHHDLGPELIDFDDMIWLPVITGCRMWENDFIFVDEAQDTNPARRALARKMLKRNGRAVFVGDRHQAIYGFTGADNDAIDQIIRSFNCQTIPLTVTFRCPKAVVRLAQQSVSHIEAAETAPEGATSSTTLDDLIRATKTGTQAWHATEDAILCRKTKPLVEMAYALIRMNVACHVEGRDIGMGLLKLVNRFQARTIRSLRDQLTAYGEREVEKLKSKGKETQAGALADRIDTLFVIMDAQPPAITVDELRNRIAAMFLDGENEPKKTLTLATVHKSKGREWRRVYVLGYQQYMPSPWARQQWQLDQELNLKYVAVTRSMGELITVHVEE